MTDKKVKQNKQKKISRDEKARVEARKKQFENSPLNKFLNSGNEDGTRKYPIADKIIKMSVLNTEVIIKGFIRVQVLLHQLRFSKKKAKEYYQAYISDKPINFYTNEGKRFSRDDCYLGFIEQSAQNHATLEEIRKALLDKLLPMVDDETFTMEQFNTYIEQTDKIVSELDLELFPTSIKEMKPL